MAIKYVDSAAAGANDGTSWTDAWTSLLSADGGGTAAGDTVFVDAGHSELPASDVTVDFSNGTVLNPIKILCVDKTDDSLSSGAVFGTASTNYFNLNIRGNCFWYGFVFKWTYGLIVGTQIGVDRFVNCVFRPFKHDNAYGTFRLGYNGNDYHSATIYFDNCAYDRDTHSYTSYSPIVLGAGTLALINGLTIQAASPGSVGAFQSAGDATYGGLNFLEVINSDLATFDYLLHLSVARPTIANFRRCKIKSGAAIITGTKSRWLHATMDACAAGTITIPPLLKTDTQFGSIAATTAVYRTGGADDGLQANAYSWAMTANSSALELFSPLESPPLVAWIDPDASISGATAKGLFTSTRCGLRQTPDALNTDGVSTWNGSGVGTQQQIDVSLSNGETLTVFVASGGNLDNDQFWIEVSEPDQVGGPITVRCFLATPSTTVYVDPKIEISGKVSTSQWFAEGVQLNGGEEGGGGMTLITKRKFVR